MTAGGEIGFDIFDDNWSRPGFTKLLVMRFIRALSLHSIALLYL